MKAFQNYGIFLWITLSAQILFSQTTVDGTVQTVGMNPEPVKGALVELIDQADTTQVFSTTTDAEGIYSIEITTTGIEDGSVQTPETFQLYQNYPNPFNPSTVISYALPTPADVRLEIYNVLGQKVRTLFDGFQANTFGRVMWDGTADNGQGVSAGMYIYSLVSDGVRVNKKMLLLDGHSSPSSISGASIPMMQNPGQLNKAMSTNYLIRVSGDTLSTITDTLTVTANMTHDVTIYRTMTDQDSNVYKIVKIGNQWWMAEDFRVTHYRNGDAIPNVTDNTEWTVLTTGAYCYYYNDSNNATDYGALYNWFAVNDNRNIAPAGWHVPTDNDWKVLEMTLGMSQSEADDIGGRGTDVGGKLKETGTEHWSSPNTGATNESGFSARPGGYRLGYDGGNFYSMGNCADYWSATESEYSNISACHRYLLCNDDDVYRGGGSKRNGFSVRLVRDNITTNTPPTASFTVNPESGTIGTTFVFNASGCVDNEDPAEALQVRWDWESDGVWDTEYSTIKTAEHQFETEGEKKVRMEVKDTDGLTASTTRQVTVVNDQYGAMIDNDGNEYVTVKIGDQWWMAENLKTTTYRNGDNIDNVTDNTEWTELTTGAYCYYNNDLGNATDNGALYNGYAVNDSRNIAPAGWHVPTDDEWKELEMCLGMSQSEADSPGWRGTDEGGKLKEAGTEHWCSPNTGATNESGFSARPGGYRGDSSGSFSSMGYLAYYWSATEVNRGNIWYRKLDYGVSDVSRINYGKYYGFSVRLVQDN